MVVTTIHKNIPKPVVLSANDIPAKYTAPNGKVYIIHTLSTGAYIFERPDGSISSKKFATYQNVARFINENNQNLQSAGTYISPNGKKYMIINNTTSKTYLFQRPDGSISGRTFSTKNAVIAFLRENNPLLPIKYVATKRTVSPAVPTAKISTTTPKIIPTVTVRKVAPTVAKPTISSTVATTAAAQAAALARAKAQAASQINSQTSSQPVIQTPVKTIVQTPAPAPKVDTTTAVS